MDKFANFRPFNHLLIFILKIILRRKCASIIVSIIIVVFCILYISYISYSKCSYDEVEKSVSSICDKYYKSEALGNLCIDLCEHMTLKPHNCLPNHSGKEVVFEALYFDDHVIVKSSKLYMEDFDQIYYIDETGSKVYPNADAYYSMLLNTLKVNLDIPVLNSSKQSIDLLTSLWTKNLSNFHYLPFYIQNAVMNNMWSLTQQTEYLLLKYYEHKNIFPKLIGTCGHFYAVEFINPLDNFLLIFYPAWQKDFNIRANLALKILKYLEEIEANFPFLHICDVKVGHFGLDKNFKVKLIDMDMVFSEASLAQNMAAIRCTTDQDCSFIDCKGSCSIPKQRCNAKVLDTNFQRVCLNVFSGKWMQSYFGLLSHPPAFISEELHSLLNQCSQHLNGKNGRVIANQLKYLLDIAINS